jgi:hypothetical protein
MQARIANARSDGPSTLLQRNCAQDYRDAEVRDCSFGDEASPVPIVLLGDSHAAHWFSAVEPVAVKRGWRLVTMIKSACAMVDVPFFYAPLGRMYTECGEWRTTALEKIREIRPLVTVMSSAEGYSFQEAEWREGISAVIKELAEASQTVLILRDTPSADFDVPTCLARRLWRPAFIPSPACVFRAPEASKIYDFQRLAARRYGNVTVVDLSQKICPGGVCAAEQDNLILYRDSNHLTASFVASMQGSLSRQIDEALAVRPGNAGVLR